MRPAMFPRGTEGFSRAAHNLLVSRNHNMLCAKYCQKSGFSLFDLIGLLMRDTFSLYKQQKP